MTPEVFAPIVTHVYSNVQEVKRHLKSGICTRSKIRFQLNPDVVYEVLEAADMFLLTGLKRQCGLFLAQYIEMSNAVDLLESARLYAIPRLEHQCTEFMAANIEEVSAFNLALI